MNSNLQYRGPKAWSPPIPPHKSAQPNAASSSSFAATALSAAARASLTTATPYAAPELQSHVRDADNRADNHAHFADSQSDDVIPPYAIGFIEEVGEDTLETTDGTNSDTASACGTVKSEITSSNSLFDLLPGAKVRSCSEPSVFYDEVRPPNMASLMKERRKERMKERMKENKRENERDCERENERGNERDNERENERENERMKGRMKGRKEE